MAALIVMGEEEWAAVGPFLRRLRDFGGALIVPPGPAAVLAAAATKEPPAEIFDYDFGGEPDLMIDLVGDLGELGREEIKEQYENGDLSVQAEAAARAYGITPAGMDEGAA